MRTDAEILDRINEINESDFLGFVTGDLVSFLPFDAARPFLIDSATPEKWEALPRDRAAIIASIKEYMPFAWGKANNCRGLSAGRSINHMQAWLWMLGEDRAVEQIDHYEYYGKPQLRAICERFGWNWQEWDDGEWRNDSESRGRPPEQVPPVILSWVDGCRS